MAAASASRIRRGSRRWALASLLAMALAPSVAQAAGTLAINADGDTVTWQTTGDVGQRWGLYLRHRRSTPAPVTAW